MTSRKVSVRLAADGGQIVKNEMRELGREGRHALDLIAAGGVPASAGLADVASQTNALLTRLEQLSAKAAKAAEGLRDAGAGAGSLAQRINQVTGVTTTFRRSADDIAAYGQAMDDVRAAHNPLYAVIRQYKGQLAEIRAAHAVGAISADEMTAAIARERQGALASIAAIKGRTNALNHMADASKFARFQFLNLTYQLNDVFVSLASGMNPMMVAAQQGSQIAQIYAGQGGVAEAYRQTAGAMKNLIGKHPALTAAIVATGVAWVGLRHEINETGDVMVSFGDVALAVAQLTGEGIKRLLQPAIDWLAPAFSGAWDIIVAGVHQVGNVIINAFRAAIETVKSIFTGLPTVIGAAIYGSVNVVLTGVEQMINGAIGLLNDMIDTVNSLLAKIPRMPGAAALQIPPMGDVSLGTIDNPYAGAAQQGWQDYQDRIREIMADDPMGDAFDAIARRARENARRRQAAEQGGGGGGGGKKRIEEEKQGLDALLESLDAYVDKARDIGKAVGDAIVGAFNSAEQAIGNFVKTGKLEIGDLAASIIADFAMIASRRYILGPIANLLSSAIGGSSWLQGVLAPTASFDGGGFTGYGARTGGLDGKGGFMAMMHPRETVVDHTKGGSLGAPVYVTIHAKDVQSFRQSRAQVAADISRAIALGRRAS